MYQKLFEPNHETNPRLNQQSGVSKVYELVKPIISTDHNINKIHSFSECYTKEDLSSYLIELTKAFQDSNQDLAIRLENHNHAILLRYNAKKGLWNFVDANQLEKVNIPYGMNNENDVSKLASNIFEAFHKISGTDMVGFATTIYSKTVVDADIRFSGSIKNKLVETLNQKIQQLQPHRGTNQNKLINNYRLYIASKNGHTEIVKAILAKDASFNPKIKAEFNSMDIAIRKGHLEVVKALLDYCDKSELNKIDHNKSQEWIELAKRQQSEPTTNSAANKKYQEIVKVLTGYKDKHNSTVFSRAGAKLPGSLKHETQQTPEIQVTIRKKKAI